MPRVVASIESRMGSSRFPGKALTDICGKPALGRLIQRLKHCLLLDGIILATTEAPDDAALESLARNEQIDCYRGSQEDVLLRVVEAHRKVKSDIIVEVTGDCILLDPQLIDMGVRTFLENDCDVVTNVRNLSFPMGEDIQVFRLETLEGVEEAARDQTSREHVSLYMYEHPELFRIIHLFAPQRWHAPEYRFQLDYQEDAKFIRQIYSRLMPKYGEIFGIEEIMALLKAEPDLLKINGQCLEKPVR
jgi:spore coat polysaccharide biosynthesis protein SpsF